MRIQEVVDRVAKEWAMAEQPGATEEQFQQPYPDEEQSPDEVDIDTPADEVGAEAEASDDSTEDDAPAQLSQQERATPPDPLPSPGEQSAPSPWVGETYTLGFEENPEELETTDEGEWVTFAGPDCIVTLRRDLLPNQLPKRLSVRPKGDYA